MIKSNDQDPGDGERAGDRQADPDTELRILDAARRVFVRRGTSGARMAEIAQEAGVNQALLHYYFRNKAGLAEAVFRRAARDLFPPVFRALTSEQSLPDKVRSVVEIELDKLLRHPFLPGYVLSELNHHPERVPQFVEALVGVRIDEVGAQVLGGLQAQIDDAAAKGEMRAMPAHQFIINLLSLCIFPFAARPMLKALTGMDDESFAAMIERRKRDLPEFFLQGMRP